MKERMGRRTSAIWTKTMEDGMARLLSAMASHRTAWRRLTLVASEASPTVMGSVVRLKSFVISCDAL